MGAQNCPMTSKEVLDTYFIDNRARLLEIASFLDRIDRAGDPAGGRSDFRYRSLMQALRIVLEAEGNRTESVQLNFSDLTSVPLDSAAGLKAWGACETGYDEAD